MMFVSFFTGIAIFLFIPSLEKPLGTLLAVSPFFIATLLALITYFRVRHANLSLVRPRLFKSLLALLLLSSSITTVASGSTVVISAKSSIGFFGLAFLGAVNLVIAILTWRTLTRPTQERAARVGMLATLQLLAAAPDIANTANQAHLDTTMFWTGLAVLAALFSMCTGSLACIASLTAFAPRADDRDIPAARIVEA